MKIFTQIERARNWKNIESFTYWIIWVILIVFPVIFWDYNDKSDRWRIVFGWFRILPFLIIFIFHNYWLLPSLVHRKRVAIYLTGTLFLILLVNYLLVYFPAFHDFFFRLFQGNLFRQTMPPGNPPGIEQGPINDVVKGAGHGPGHPEGMGHWRRHFPNYLIFIYNIFLSILIVGANGIMRFSRQWLTDEQKRKEIEKEHVQSRLTALQHQVSPHFFMNTLNNIHALVDYNKEDAKEAIIRLSQLMRYLLYESEQGRTTLRKEINFLNNYIDLMRLRVDQSVKITINFPESVPDIAIHPYLFIPFVENAFKFGIIPIGDKFITIILELSDQNIHFNVKNSNHPLKQEDKRYSGIGLVNAKKRMELLYGPLFSLQIRESETAFEIDLMIPYEDQVYSH
jgi:hypothetical protein